MTTMMEMEQYLVKEPFHCPFYDEACRKEECPSFTAMRPYTRMELQGYWAHDIPVFDGGVKQWCLKYDRCVRERHIIKERPIEH